MSVDEVPNTEGSQQGYSSLLRPVPCYGYALHHLVETATAVANKFHCFLCNKIIKNINDGVINRKMLGDEITVTFLNDAFQNRNRLK